MENRINAYQKGPKAVETLSPMMKYLRSCSVEKELLALLEFRVSQINACAYCLDMHHKEARHMGESEQRLYGMSAWKESPYYTPRERAAFLWAEAVTSAKVPDEVYAEVKAQFSDEEMVDLTLASISINAWNRLNLAFPMLAGSYRVGMFG